MREYAKVSPKFWIGKSGKSMRGNPEAQLIALYLMTCPTSEMTGVFHCPIMYMAHETGLGLEGAMKGLRSLNDNDFCTYDDETESVFVHEMARYQIGENLKINDNQVKGVQKAFLAMTGPIKNKFYKRYKDVFYLEKTISSEPPSKALESQEKEQEQEQEQEQNIISNPNGLLAVNDVDEQTISDQSIKIESKSENCPHQEIIAIYHEVLPSCPKIREWTPTRATNLRARWNESKDRQNLDYWRRFFEYVRTCDFLVGKSDKPFFASLDWIVMQKNFTKIREERYANR